MFARRARLILLYLLMLALPFQAVAGALMPMCAAEQSLGAMEDAHGVSGVAAEHHGHHDSHLALADLGDNHHGPDGSHVGCSLCASSCHSVGALSSSGLTVNFPVLAELRTRAYQSFNGHIADIPRRPPRPAIL